MSGSEDVAVSQSAEGTPFQFTGYKIDKLELELYPALDLVEETPNSEWDHAVSFRVPEFHKSRKTFLIGFNIVLKQTAKIGEETVNLVLLKCSIVGTFRVSDGVLTPEMQNKMVSQHLPTILFPYYRAAVTSILATGGYGSFNFPLININALAKQHLGSLAIIERD